MLNEWRLALRCFIRECRAGQWMIVFFALVLAVTMMTSINFFTDRLSRGLNQQSAQLLGGDLVISSSMPISKTWQQKADNMSLRTADVYVFPSVVSANNQLQLVNIQAISDSYPLFGKKMDIESHTLLTEERLLPLLSIHLGDAMTIGTATFTIKGLMNTNIDMINTGWAIAPRVLMRMDDVASTHVILPGSRIQYQLLVAGEKKAIQAYRSWLTPKLSAGQKIIDVASRQSSLQNSLQHADKYIQLVILFCLLMCGTAITLSVRQHLHRHYEDVALWRCLGAPEKQITSILIKQLILISVAAGALGSLIGFFIETYIVKIFYTLIDFPLPPAGILPIVLGFSASVILLFCYAYPIITSLPRTSPLYLWRSNSHDLHKHTKFYAIITLVLLLGYVYWMMDFSLIALFILDSLLLSIGFIYALNVLTFSMVKKLMNISNGIIRRGLSQFIQYPETASIQLTAFTLVLMSLFILGNVKHNLLGDWQATLPSDTPNYFAFNIAPYEIEEVKSFFAKQNIVVEDIYPMVRGRLTELNQQPIMQAIPPHAAQHNALHRDLNLSSMMTYPTDNQLTQGSSFTVNDDGKLIVSVESKLATELNLKLGDQLGFQIGDQQLVATLTNIRSVDWGSFHPNFYIIFPTNALNKYPSTFITSFHLQPNQSVILNKLVKKFPNITIIDIASMLQQAQGLLAKISMALQYLFSFAICAAILIFITSVIASMDERRETYKVLRTIGASRKYIIGSLIVEFSFLAALTILFAYVFAKFISYLLIAMIF